MSLEQTLDKVQKDLQCGDLGKARDRLHGLIVNNPDKIELRRQLGNIYWQLQLPEMAGRYWYLEEEKDERMVKACHRFEKQFNNDPALILFAMRFKGNVEIIEDTYSGRTLQELHQKAKEKHSWYEDFRSRGSSKYRQYKYDSKKHKIRDAIIKRAFISIILLSGFLLIVGAISVIKWFF